MYARRKMLACFTDVTSKLRVAQENLYTTCVQSLSWRESFTLNKLLILKMEKTSRTCNSVERLQCVFI